MTVPMLKGWFDEIEEPLKNIVGVLDERLHPNKKLQKAMRDLVASNPQMLQQFADLSARDPQLLQRMGLQNIQGMISGLPESAASVKERQEKTFLSTPDTPVERSQRIANVKGVRDPLEQKQAETNLDLSELNKTLTSYFASTAPDEAKARGAEAQAKFAEILELPEGRKALGLIKDNYENKSNLTPEQLRILSTNPRLKPEFDRIRDDYWNKQVEEGTTLRLSRTGRMSQEEREQNALYNAILRSSEEIADYAGVPFQLAFQYSSLSPDKQLELRNAPSPPSPELEGVWRAAQGTKMIGDSKRVTFLKRSVDLIYADPVINGALKTLRDGKRQNKPAALSMLNSTLAARSAAAGITNPPVWEMHEERPLLGRNKMTFSLKSGDFAFSSMLAKEAGLELTTPAVIDKEERDNAVLSDTEKLNQDAQMLANVLATLPDEAARQRYLDEYAAERGQAVYAEIRKLLDKYRKTR